jgi:uncharacterized membrane protein YadS
MSHGVALGTVFLLNALALVVYPPIGHFTHLGQDAFGIWAALAIHDTSSVVGAGLATASAPFRSRPPSSWHVRFGSSR